MGGLLGKFIAGAAGSVRDTKIDEMKADLVAKRDATLHRYKMEEAQQEALLDAKTGKGLKWIGTPSRVKGKDNKYYFAGVVADAKEPSGFRTLMLPVDADFVDIQGLTGLDEKNLNVDEARDILNVKIDLEPTLESKKVASTLTSEHETNIKLNEKSARHALIATRDDAKRVTGMIDDVLGRVNYFTTGAANAIAWIPGTPMKDLEEDIDAIRANIGFDRLEEMRKNSPNGSALGNTTEKEIKFLQSVLGSLDPGQGPTNLKKNLNRANVEIRKSFERIYNAYQDTYGTLQPLNNDETQEQIEGDGNIPTLNNPNTQLAPPPPDVLAEAKSAIAKKANRQEIINELRRLGYSAEGL